MMARTEWKNADWLSPLSVVATIQTAGPSSSIQSSRIRTSKSNSMSSANRGVHVAWIPEDNFGHDLLEHGPLFRNNHGRRAAFSRRRREC